jgi:hypothetical protein
MYEVDYDHCFPIICLVRSKASTLVKRYRDVPLSNFSGELDMLTDYLYI